MGAELFPTRLRTAARGQAGISLIEVIVVIAVLVPIILAATLGLLTTARLSTDTKVSQELNAAAASYSESLKEVAYVGCADVDGYDGAAGLWAPPAGSDIDIDVTGVEYWKQATTTYGPGCASDEGSQLITIELSDLDGTAELSVVKRDPAGYPVPVGP